MFENNPLVAMAKSLARTIQNDQLFLDYMEARKANDADTELQSQLSDFYSIQDQMDSAITADEKDLLLIEGLSNKLDTLYQSIMNNPNMIRYTDVKGQYDKLMRFINQIILTGMNGGDPETVTEESCSGNCSGCSGCN